MTLTKNLILCIGASLALVACAECPRNSEYDKVPYKNTRTAGTGMAEYGSACATEAPPAQEEVVVAPTPAPAPEPAPVAPQPEPPVFREQQTK